MCATLVYLIRIRIAFKFDFPLVSIRSAGACVFVYARTIMFSEMDVFEENHAFPFSKQLTFMRCESWTTIARTIQRSSH